MEYALQFGFRAINNEGEYEALIIGLQLAKELEIKNLRVFSDSQFVIGQVWSEYEARDSTMTKYLQKLGKTSIAFLTQEI